MTTQAWSIEIFFIARETLSRLTSLSAAIPATSNPLLSAQTNLFMTHRRGRTARLRQCNGSKEDNFDHGKVIHDTNFEEFRHWLRERGYPKSKITLAEFKETGRGMMATVDLEPGDTLVSVPKNILITASEVAKRLNVGHQLDSNQLLVLEICRLKQQGAKSSWWPYVRLLPQDFNTMPVTYPEDVLKSALPPHLTAEIQEQKAKIDADYRHVVQYSKNTSLGVEDIDYKEFEWAWLCVNTRCIHLGMEDRSIVGGNIALAPMLDFLNHKSDAQFECGYNRKTQSFDIRTLMPYRRGQQVFFQYGAHDNAFLLKEYGFVVANNPYSAINLDDQMSKLFARLRVSGKFGAMKLKMLEENGYYGDYTIRRNDISFRTLTALRLIMATDKVQCSAWQRCLLGSQDIISEEIEQQVGLLLGDMCANTVRRSERALEYLQNLKLQESSELMVDSFAALFLETLWKEYISIGQAAQIELIPGLLTSSNS